MNEAIERLKEGGLAVLSLSTAHVLKIIEYSYTGLIVINSFGDPWQKPPSSYIKQER